MKMVKSLILGSAAALVAMSGAQAADLPVKAKAVEYVKVCSLYGAGFWYIPGTDTCIKLGGYIRADVSFNASGAYDAPAWNGASGQLNRNRNYMIYRSRNDFTLDTRTATEYGVVRTFFDATFNWTTGSDNFAGGTLGVYFAFIQFAGFTVGKAISQFDSPWTAYPGNNTSFLLGGESNETGINQIAYTAQFGNGVSGSISLEDPSAYRQSSLYNTSVPIPATVAGIVNGAVAPVAGTTAGQLALYGTGVYGTNSYGGVVAPDVVGQLRVDQAWGLFQLSAAAHNVHANYYTPTAEISGHPNDRWGYAAQVALSIKNLPTGPGDSINFTAGYAYGASRYIFSHGAPGNLNVNGNFAMYGSSSTPGVYQTLAIGGLADGVFTGTTAANGSGISLSSAFGVRGAFNHNWDAYWSSSLFGAYSTMRWGAAGAAAICNANVLAAYTAGSTCSPNYNIAQIGGVTRWTPVKNLTFSGEVMYTYLDQRNAGFITLPAIPTKPAAVYQFKDQGTWTAGLRAQRVF